LLARAFFLVRFLLRRFPRAVMNALCWLYQIAEPDSKFQRWDAVIVIKGTVLQVRDWSPWILQMLVLMFTPFHI
jgi:hypothetical protein